MIHKLTFWILPFWKYSQPFQKCDYNWGPGNELISKYWVWLLGYIGTITHAVVVVSDLWSAGTFIIVGLWCYNPWQYLIGDPIYIMSWWHSNPWRVTVLPFWYTSYTPNRCMCPGPYGCCTLTINIAIRIHFLASQSCLWDEPRDTSPKGYDLRLSLTGWNQEFHYYSVAYKYYVQYVVDILHVSCINMFWIYPLQNILIIFEFQTLTGGRTMNSFWNIGFDP